MNSSPFRISLYLPVQAAAETEATIVAIKVKAGDSFKKNEVLAEVESAKAAFNFEAPCDGVVINLFCADGDTISFEKAVLEIETSDASMKTSVPMAADSAQLQTSNGARPVSAQLSGFSSEVSIIGLGGYLPDRVVKTDELLGKFPDVTADYILGVTGIKERRWAADGEKPSDLAYNAALDALARSGKKPEDIDILVVSTATPDFAMPSTACILSRKLGLKSGVPAFDINAACSGWLYSLTVAKGLIRTGVGHTALVVGAELQSRLIDSSDKGTYFLFGDGAGAAVISDLEKGHVIKDQILFADGEGLHLARRSSPGFLIDKNGEEIDPWIRVDGHQLFKFATGRFATIIRDVTLKSGWEVGDIRWVVPHQANGRIIKAAAQKSGIPFERFYLNIERVGNTSSASIPLALLEIANGLQKGDKIVLCSVGAGITAAALSIEW